MGLSKEAIWKQVFPKDAELRIQQAFEILLRDEFGLTDCAQQRTTIDQSSWEDYNQGNGRTTINFEGSRRPVKSVQKINSQIFMDKTTERF